MTSLTSTFLLPGFKLDGGETSSGKEVDDRSLLGPRGPTLSSEHSSISWSNQWDTLQFSTDGRSGHLFSDGRSGHSSVFHGRTCCGRTCSRHLFSMDMVQTLFGFPRMDSFRQITGPLVTSPSPTTLQIPHKHQRSLRHQNSWNSTSDISETEPGIYRATWV